ncbi:Type VI secretion, VasB, ImpH, VC_A0111 [Chryseobacterium rhizoplanae]|uniref:Type VI secretion, VasB, ImpH, VC_A0111 n=1 Tax=Chryseobacterium rhizoplanae TaxID=1609531 RepID=A0A521DM87_9FLAO|nr:type VI secretion system baseplate subunit TssG [Chryseobacterium rhizoplanae]SMO72712.1 Type VI secretion, VasB, ImpH, VC_A0111 [Chryseobacterium rhizoplanae]
MKHFENIAKQINSLPYDIRAEVIINNLLENNDLQSDNFIVEKDGQFSRAYRYDVLDAESGNYSFGSEAFLKLVLSRDSIYDMLPENIVHDISNHTAENNVDIMIQEYRIKKQDQKNSRLFFQPFENEIFSYGIRIENFEQDLFCQLHSSNSPELFYELWGIRKDVPPEMASRLIRILPFAYKIVGNTAVTCRVFSLLMEEEVRISRKSWKKYYDDMQNSCLGSCKLGLDMVSGNNYDHYTDHINLSIGPLKNGLFSDYLNEGKRKWFLDLLCSYFFSAETEIEITILLSKQEEDFDLNVTKDTVLGYNTRI